MPPASVPKAPKNLLVLTMTPNQVDLTWTDRANNETKYVVERAVGSGAPWAWRAVLGVNKREYSAKDLLPNTLYYFRVRAENATGGSLWSNVVSARTLTAQNQGPVANVTLPTDPEAGTLLTIDPRESFDPDGEIVAGQIEWGDGLIDVWSGPPPLLNHLYANAGTFTLTLTVTDEAGMTGSLTSFLTVMPPTPLPPAPPQPPIPGGNVIRVPAGGDLQAALNAAVGGDTIMLAAGASYLGPYTLPPHPGAAYVTITSDGAIPTVEDTIAGCLRIGPTLAAEQAKKLAWKAARKAHFAACNMPKIYTTNSTSAIATAKHADYWKFVGVEFHTTHQPKDVPTYAITAFGLDGPYGLNIQTLAELPEHIYFDRCYLHGNTVGSVRRAILANCVDFTCINSFIDEIHELGIDNQCIMAYNGPGPFWIENNFLEAACENLLFGGAHASAENMAPADIVETRNFMSKDFTWWSGCAAIGFTFGGVAWWCKNTTECKDARRIQIYGNVIENSWAMNQDGAIIVMQSVDDSSGAGPWALVKDLEIYNNIIRNGASAFSVGGRITYSMMGSNFHFHHNLCYNLTTTFGSAKAVGLSSGSGFPPATVPFDGVVIDHNTFDNDGVFAVLNSMGDTFTGMRLTNNLVRAPGNIADPGEWYNAGIIGSGAGGWSEAFAVYAPTGVVCTKNIVGTYAPQPSMPAGNERITPEVWAAQFVDRTGRNYALVPGSPYKNAATDGTDIGCNLSLLPAGS
jgi:hypothetical protein